MSSMPRMAALIHNDGMEPTIRQGSIAVSEYPQLSAKKWEIVGYRSPLTLEQACFIASRDSTFFKGLGRDQLEAFYKEHFATFGPMRINRVGRIVALGGESIELKSDGIYINNSKASPPGRTAELYSSLPDGAWKKYFSAGPINVPEHEVFILQDNLEKGNDSRTLGTVKLTSILGTLNNVIEPEEILKPGFFNAEADRFPKDLLQDLEEQHGPMSTWFKPN